MVIPELSFLPKGNWPPALPVSASRFVIKTAARRPLSNSLLDEMLDTHEFLPARGPLEDLFLNGVLKLGYSRVDTLFIFLASVRELIPIDGAAKGTFKPDQKQRTGLNLILWIFAFRQKRLSGLSAAHPCSMTSEIVKKMVGAVTF